jgi:hypothetical protein
VKRIFLVGAAVAGLLVAGVATAPASTIHSANKPASNAKKPSAKPITLRLTCAIKLATQIPSNDVTVTQGSASGTQFGTVGCGSPLDRGAEKDSFTLSDAGDLSGPYQQWFNTGSVFGKYSLAPNDNGPPTPTSFAAASYTGKITVSNGTGAFKGAAGTGTLTCSTSDSAHYTCTEKLKLS